MGRPVTLATCQPPMPGPGHPPPEVEQAALDLLDEAGRLGADLTCLPEYLNGGGLLDGGAPGAAFATAEPLLSRIAEICARWEMFAIAPLVHESDGPRNSAFVVGRDGSVLGRYDKVHLTKPEAEALGLVPGDGFPVFELDFGVIGVMLCYDLCFPEPARCLALEGAEIILCPSLQRSYTEAELDLQVRSRAFDNFVYLVRSSYGTPPGEPWRPGMIAGKSCIVAPDSTILADLGRRTGVALRQIDLDLVDVGARSHGGEIGPLRAMRLEDRRPETYGRLCR
ncbi:MAG: carbon-nitrogen hydrolase family protein [Armatimonadetes bacterium]|nr:carbon-nitrogen hydrolase family protein [Armatimonadota bacterium]